MNESNADLMETRQELRESKTQIADLQAALMGSESETAALMIELQQQQQETAKLKERLQALEAESKTAENSIAKANEYLQNTRLEFQAREREHERTEAALKNKLTAWQIVAALLGVGLAFS